MDSKVRKGEIDWGESLTVIAEEAPGRISVTVEPCHTITIAYSGVIHALLHKRYQTRLQQVLELFQNDNP
jgi:hypothetical protein